MQRYLEITVMNGRIPKTVVEYFGDFGMWNWKSSPFRYQVPFSGQRLFISAKFHITKAQVDATCLLLENHNQKWENVDMLSAGKLPKKLQRKTKEK